MVVHPKIARVGLLSLLFVALAALATVWTLRKSLMPPAVEPFICQPLPVNLRLVGPALPAAQADSELVSYGEASVEIRSHKRPGDQVYAFESATTGGHVVMRGTCYIGHVVSWIR
jgi:hypothetical protein